jgi:preprotein translocase subunit SecF
MEFFKTLTQIDFMGKRKLFLIFSAVLSVLSLALVFGRGLSLGIDFTGGTVVEVGYPEPVELRGVRDALEEGGFGGAIVQYFGTSREILIRLQPRADGNSAQQSDEVFSLLKQQSGGTADLRRVEFVGPQVGEDLREEGGLAVLFSLIAILIYVALRFEYRFAFAAILATLHDVVVTMGIFALTGMDFDLTVLAAILTVIGYSLNDTIVVFDRIRENFRKLRKTPVLETLNISVNQTLSRTVMTGGTTILVTLSLIILGGETIQAFSVTLLIGILVGTYSSIYVASPLLVLLNVSKADLMPVKKEGEELSARP